MLDEAEKESVREQARALLEKFSNRLSNAKISSSKQVHEGTGMRQKAGNPESSKTFKQNIIDNAPVKDDDFIIAEKKKW